MARLIKRLLKAMQARRFAVLPLLSRATDSLFKQLSHRLLPSSCSFCLAPLQPPAGTLCYHCVAELPRLTTQCQWCAVALPKNALCGNCQQNPPSYRRCISAFHYQAPVDNIILRLKGNPYTTEIKQLCAILAQHIAATYQQAQLPCPQTIIPLPLHWLKMTKRGFNQSHIISNLLAADLRREHKVTLEIRSDICRRILKGQDQHLLSAKKRRTSIKNAFIAEAKDLTGLSVAIVDDVVTTGATANSAAKALLRAGAAQVDIWSIARTSWNNPTG
jgi:ComF family protein